MAYHCCSIVIKRSVHANGTRNESQKHSTVHLHFATTSHPTQSLLIKLPHPSPKTQSSQARMPPIPANHHLLSLLLTKPQTHTVNTMPLIGRGRIPLPLNTCPKCPPHFAHTISVLAIPNALSVCLVTAPGILSKYAGHPHPLLNL